MRTKPEMIGYRLSDKGIYIADMQAVVQNLILPGESRRLEQGVDAVILQNDGTKKANYLVGEKVSIVKQTRNNDTINRIKENLTVLSCCQIDPALFRVVQRYFSDSLRQYNAFVKQVDKTQKKITVELNYPTPVFEWWNKNVQPYLQDTQSTYRVLQGKGRISQRPISLIIDDAERLVEPEIGQYNVRKIKLGSNQTQASGVLEPGCDVTLFDPERRRRFADRGYTIDSIRHISQENLRFLRWKFQEEEHNLAGFKRRVLENMSKQYDEQRAAIQELIPSLDSFLEREFGTLLPTRVHQ